VRHNPSVFVHKHPGKIFAGEQADHRFGHWVVQRYFRQLGGTYQAWYKENQFKIQLQELNAGLLGGRRADVLRFADLMEAVLLDPDLALKKQAKPHWFDMGPFNYVLRANFSASDVVSGYPLHSEYYKWDTRQDVYIAHK